MKRGSFASQKEGRTGYISPWYTLGYPPPCIYALPASLGRWVPPGSVHARVGVTVEPSLYTVWCDRCALLAWSSRVVGRRLLDLKKGSKRAESGRK